MNKYKKTIAKSASNINREIEAFTSLIDKANEAIQVQDQVVSDLENEIKECQKLISIANSEKEKAINFKNSITGILDK